MLRPAFRSHLDLRFHDFQELASRVQLPRALLWQGIEAASGGLYFCCALKLYKDHWAEIWDQDQRRVCAAILKSLESDWGHGAFLMDCIRCFMAADYGDSVPLLQKLSIDRKSAVRASATRALLNLASSKQATQAVMRAIEDADEDVRSAGFDGVAQLGLRDGERSVTRRIQEIGASSARRADVELMHLKAQFTRSVRWLAKTMAWANGITLGVTLVFGWLSSTVQTCATVSLGLLMVFVIAWLAYLVLFEKVPMPADYPAVRNALRVLVGKRRLCAIRRRWWEHIVGTRKWA